MEVIKDALYVTGCLVCYVAFICIICYTFSKIVSLFKKGEKNMKNIKTFEKELIAAIEKSGHKVEINIVTKMGDVRKRGITIDPIEGEAMPVFYVEDLYDLYVSGMTIDEMVHTMENMSQPSLRETKAFKNAMDKNLTYRLLNVSRNEALLQEHPHKIICGDIALCLQVMVDDESGDGVFCSLVHNESFKDGMWERASMTAPTLSPAIMKTLADTMLGVDDNVLLSGNVDLSTAGYVLTNENYLFGASALFYDGVKERIYDLIGEYYALPASIHEWIIVPVKDGTNDEVDALKEMVVRGNDEVVDYAEVLSKFVYLYDGKELKIA